MEKIHRLFKQLQAALKEENDLKTYQEIQILADDFSYCVRKLRESALIERKEYIDFFQDAHLSEHFSFGQCGDRVYWKILDGILYIEGCGPMWDFNNLPIEHKTCDIYTPWRGLDYDTVIILPGVTTIGSEAFCDANISTVIIPSSIKTVNTIAFWEAQIEKLVLPETIERVEDGILTGFKRVVDTLVVSANIANIKPYAFFNRDDIVANTVILEGTLPDDLKPLVDSRLFDDAGCYKIHYPESWDTEESSFYTRLITQFTAYDDVFSENLKHALIPHKIQKT